MRCAKVGTIKYTDVHNDMRGSIRVESRGMNPLQQQKYQEMCKEEDAEQRLLASLIGSQGGVFGSTSSKSAQETAEEKEREESRRRKHSTIRRENLRQEEEERLRAAKDPKSVISPLLIWKITVDCPGTQGKRQSSDKKLSKIRLQCTSSGGNRAVRQTMSGC